jgi:transcription elongation factor GreB
VSLDADSVIEMSKAFTRESDDMPERPPAPRPAPALPPGVRNYVTPSGAKSLEAELETLLQKDSASPRLAALRRILQTIEVVPTPEPPHNQARFGATVTVRDSSGHDETYRIVGVDETDIDRDWISWLSPLARALLNAHLGETVRVQLPAGERVLEIVAISYEAT